MTHIYCMLAACLLTVSSGLKTIRGTVDPTGLGIPEQDMIDMLTALHEVVLGMDKEEEAFTKISEAREQTCTETQSNLMKSMEDGNRTLQAAKRELSQAQSEVQSIQGSMDTVKTEIKAVERGISDLQTELAKLRSDRVSALERDSGYHLEVQAILKRAEERINTVWKRTNAAEKTAEAAAAEEDESAPLAATETDSTKTQTAVESQVDELKQLEGNLLLSPSFLQLDVDESIFSVVHEGHRNLFSKVQSEESLGNGTETAEALKKDADDIRKAAVAAREAFELEELRLMDLIKAKRQELQPLDAQMLEQQPELADQLRKSAEAKRTVATSTKSVERDGKVLAMLQNKCKIITEARDWEKNKRPQGRAQIVLAINRLNAIAETRGMVLPPAAQAAAQETMTSAATQTPQTNTTAQATASPESFLQFGSSHDKRSDDLADAVRTALRNMVALRGRSSAAELDGNGESAMAISNFDTAMSASSELSQALLQAGNTTKSTVGEKAESTDADPFKSVKEMISELIDSLRGEQNEEKTKQTFCAEQEEKARTTNNELSSRVDEASEKVRWNDNAILDLQADIQWLRTDIARLEHALVTGQQNMDGEIARISAEAENHETAANITNRARKVLMTNCGRASGKDEVQAESDLVSGNCKEADQALKTGNKLFAELDQFLADYLIKFTNVTQEHKDEMSQALLVHKESLFQSESDLNRRKDEAAEAAADLLNAKENVMLAARTSAELDTTCGPHITKLENVIERRKEEIMQLKKAIQVIDGDLF
eukprot:TRINITY_DN7158_c1_g1_i1.p1 TRINITY_DN7158_c1_g1~~TRINITY_DN7158_c1_g1_i1.p1  ORF type:complete len:807 (+),score=230.93 TRINITY_DN7158_c1_g1_i1:98-2422(+)